MRNIFDNNLNLKRKEKPITDISELPDIPGDKIYDYNSESMRFIPTTPPKTPKEGMVYYDKVTRKLKVYNGYEFEEVSST